MSATLAPTPDLRPAAVAPRPGTPPDSSRETLDATVERLAARADAWFALPTRDRLRYVHATIAGTRRVARAQELEVDTLISACPWSERPLSQAGAEAPERLEVLDLFELVATSAGIEVGGHTHGPVTEAQA